MKKNLFILTILIFAFFAFSPSVFAEDWCHTFTITMQKGDSGDEVTALQTALMKEGLLDIPQPTGYFWTLTFNAVVNFQEKYASEILTPLGLSQGTGKVADMTRAKLNQLYGCSTNNPPISCTPSWQFGQWSTCANGQQTRTVTDLNGCGIYPGSSMLTQSCQGDQEPCAPNWYTGSWSACTNSQQTRTVTDLNSCGVTTNKPLATRACATSSCILDWNCTDWGSCTNSQQTRTCADLNNCGVTTNKPLASRSCVNACAEDWYCASWSACGNNEQTRSCVDLNNCGVNTNKPSETQSCVSTCVPIWQIGLWSSCVNNQQTRTVTDFNNCGVTTNKPLATRVCSSGDREIMSLPLTVDIKAWVYTRADLSDGPIFISNNTGVYLQWTSSNATSCAASGGWTGVKNTSNSVGVYIEKLTSFQTYTITCAGAGGTATDSIVINPTTGSVVDIKANNSDGPITVGNGSSVALSWTILNVNSCSISQNYLTLGQSTGLYVNDTSYSSLATSYGNVSVTLGNIFGSKQGFTLTCKDSSNNTKSDSVVINISAASAPIVTLKANGYSDSVTLSNLSQISLSWTSINANTCTAGGDWSGSKSTSGSETVSSYGKTSLNFSLSCTGATGTGTSSVKIVNQNFADAFVGQSCTGGNSYIQSPGSCPSGYYCNGGIGTCQRSTGGGGGVAVPLPICDGSKYTPKNSGCIPPLCDWPEGNDLETGVCVTVCRATCSGNFSVGCDGKTATKCPEGTRTVRDTYYSSPGVYGTHTEKYNYQCRKTYTTKYVYSPASGVRRIDTLSGSECYDPYAKK